MATAAVPYEHLGEALATDYFLVRDQFTDEQWRHFIEVRRFVDTEVLPAINGTGRRPSCRGRSCAGSLSSASTARTSRATAARG